MSLFSFPWDATQAELGEDGFPIYERSYGATDLQEVYKTILSNGIFMNYPNAFQVRASSNMMVAVTLGRCHIKGCIGYPDPEGEQQDLLVVPAANTQPRIDTIVLRWDKSISARSIVPDIISGTPSPNPVRPALTRDDDIGIYELGIADILVKANSTTVEQSYITDTRLENSRCGAVTPFMTIDTTSFYAKLEAAIDADLARIQREADEKLDKLENQSDAAIAKINNELDRIIFISDKLTAGKPEGCACYEEMQAIKKLLYELLGVNEQYYVIGKTLYPPKGNMTISGKQAAFSDMTVSGKTARFN